MKQTILPDYTEVSAALSTTTLNLHPSEAHGLICGILCGNPNLSISWKKLLTGDKRTKNMPVLDSLYEYSAKQLQDFLFEFHLLLPVESENLSERAEALTLWSQGFLTGLKHAHIQIMEREPSELTEAIDDILEIAKMNYEEVVSTDEDEEAYTELVEYVRMAVILIYQDCRESEASPKKQGSLNHLH